MMYPGCGWEWSKGGVNSSTSWSSFRTRSRVADCMACRERAGSADPESTAQDCGSESMRSSWLALGPHRRSVVEKGPQIPFAVPARVFDRAGEVVCPLPPERRRVRDRVCRPASRTNATRSGETSRARRFLPGLPRLLDSTRHSSRRCRSAEGRAIPAARRVRWRERNVPTAERWSRRPREPTCVPVHALRGRGLRETAPPGPESSHFR